MAHQLGRRTLELRAKSRPVRDIADELSTEAGEPISAMSVQRFLDSVERSAAAVTLRRPELVEIQANQNVDLAQRLRDAIAEVDELLPLAKTAGRRGGVNWRATVDLLGKRLDHFVVYAKLMATIYDVEQVQLFQQGVMAALDRVSPELRAEAEAELAREQRRARAGLLLGAS